MTTTVDTGEAISAPDLPLVRTAPTRLGHAAKRIASSFAGAAGAAKLA